MPNAPGPNRQRNIFSFVLVAIIFVFSGLKQPVRGDEFGAQAKPKETADTQAQSKDSPDTKAKEKDGADAKDKPKDSADSSKKKGFDPAVVSAGMAAFERGCVKCHDAARSTERNKDLAGWRTTVRRMAAKRGADIPSEDVDPISTYLASRNAPDSGGGDAGSASGGASAAGTSADKDKAETPKAESDSSSFSAFASLSPLFRGGNSHLQNPDFFPEAWIGGSWQGKIVSARVTACISCHGVQEGEFLSRVEFVEAAVRVDFSQWLDPCWKGMKGSIDAGRFIVPFGAFSSQTNPSLYRTVSTPLIFNMGQRVNAPEIGVPVLPMPYADQGVDINLDIPLLDCGTLGKITTSLDGYVINGLEGNETGIDFLESRNLADNNNRVAGGGRFTIGIPNIRIGASVTGGRFNDSSDPAGPLDYLIYGVDAEAHYKNLIRFQFEFAQRNNDRFDMTMIGPNVFSEKVAGYYIETEARPYEKFPASLLVRYDFQSNSSELPPAGSTLMTGNFNVKRITVGVNIDLWRQSLLMVDIEHWFMPEPLQSTNVFGMRYAITF
jgi:hypothetical protein